MQRDNPSAGLVLGLAAGLIAAHVALLTWGAARHAPVWDEWGHLPAGLSHWYFGHFDLYRVNPPLVRTVATVPLVLSGINIDWPGVADHPAVRLEWECGRRFLHQEGGRVIWYFTLSRWACVPFSIVGAWICFLWASRLYGSEAGLLALTLWCFSPGILGNAQLMTPDAGAAAVGAAACYLFWQWLQRPSVRRALGVGVILGLAELTKFTWALLFALWPALWLASRFAGDRFPTTRDSMTEFGHVLLILGLATVVINIGYGFEGTGTRLEDFRFVSRGLRGENTDLGNRFTNSWVAGLPVPLPANYLRGIDRQSLDFEVGLWSYLHGEWRRGGWWYYYLYALAVKEPLGTWLLAGLAGVAALVMRRYAAPLRDELALLVPLVGVLALVSSATGFNHHVRYVLPVFPFVFICTSKVAQAFRFGHRRLAFTVVGAVIWSVGSSLSYYPHSLSYFNELVGGPRDGHYHLSNSNIDWGQDLLYLKRWCDEHPDATPLGLAYYVPLVDPSSFGIQHTRPPVGPDCQFAKALPREELGPQPGWYAISVNKIHMRTREYAYFLRFEPVATAGYSIWIYHITAHEANRVRLELGLPKIRESKSHKVEESKSGNAERLKSGRVGKLKR